MDSTTSISHSKNHWRTTRRGYTIVDWVFILPQPKSDTEVQNILDLFKSIAAIAEEQNICCISTTEIYDLLEVKNYADYIEKDFLGRKDIYEPLDYNGLPSIDPPDFTTKLAYYDSNNEIVEQHIGNVGSLIAEIYDIEINKNCADPTTAITFNTYPSSEFDEKNHRHNFENKLIQVNIGLTTDIWFPWIDGDIHAYRPHGEEPYLQPVNHPTFGMVYDNRELVSYHTPRLNKFLSESHKIASSYGAEWKLDTTEGDLMYAKMCSTLGVMLD